MLYTVSLAEHLAIREILLCERQDFLEHHLHVKELILQVRDTLVHLRFLDLLSTTPDINIP
jgi:hypothetical protein